MIETDCKLVLLKYFEVTLQSKSVNHVLCNFQNRGGPFSACLDVLNEISDRMRTVATECYCTTINNLKSRNRLKIENILTSGWSVSLLVCQVHRSNHEVTQDDFSALKTLDSRTVFTPRM